MNTASALQLRRVRTGNGKVLGRAYDLRCERRGNVAVVTHLVYGRRGLLERVGFGREARNTIPWSRVLEVRDREIIVADDV